jgi:hypothetical protein
MPKSSMTIGFAGLLAFVSSAAMAGPDGSVLLGSTAWTTFADSNPAASFAWAGVDESFSGSSSLLGEAGAAVAFDEKTVDAVLLTGIAAPEPPTLVLAGMAFGGVLCGRSLLLRRKTVAVVPEARDSGA